MTVLKITLLDEEFRCVTLKIEGRVAGLEVPVLDRAWQDLAPSLGVRKLSVDLRGVTFIDAAGRDVLAEIHSRTNARFLANTPMTKYFAEEARLGTRPSPDLATSGGYDERSIRIGIE